MRLARDGDLFFLHLGDGENRLNPPSMQALLHLLDQVEAAPEPRALVTVAGGKFWCNGFDLDWATTHAEDQLTTGTWLHRVLARVLTLGVPSLAAIQGHAFGGGAMLALAHDFRVIRADRGYVCLPEIDLHMAFTDGMIALVRSKLAPATSHRLLTTGHRFGGLESVEAGMVDAAVPEAEVLDRAKELVGPLAAKHGPTLTAIKRRIYGTVEATLLQQIPSTDLPERPV